MPKKIELEVVIHPDGTVSKEVSGVIGPACADITKLFDDALGGEVIEDRKTEDFYKESDQSITVQP